LRPADEVIRLGISTCLLGERVRYDGGHKLDPFLVGTLARYVEYVPVCPEVECGLPVPRESMRLEGAPHSPRLVTSRSRQDLTDRMLHWARGRVVELEGENLSGFIFKSGSPSSGMEGVRVYGGGGIPSRTGVGLFARAFMEHFPLLPVEDEGRLHDPGLRENFIERIFALKRWRELVSDRHPRARLMEFHARHKLLILSHSPACYQTLGKLIGHSRAFHLRELYGQYQALFLHCLKIKATPKKNANVLMHMAGYFKKRLSPDEKQEMLEIIDLYRREVLPLIVPITIVKHYVRKYDQPYLKEQVYLDPHPIELQLRNHA
jgi:uncharacterized protein YbgA (DUF1722 family)/uncharacterized protein YbbK (DUF523 family)